MIDLYKTLGVNKNAAKKDIKKAYRAKAKIHHPDRNGDAELFAEISKAHAILIDDKKRRFYDETGQTDEGSKSQINGIARERLGQFFLGIIDKQKDQIFETDIIDLIEKNIFNFTEECENIIRNARKKEKRFKKIKKRIKYKRESVNLFVAIIDGKIKNCKFVIGQAEFDIKIFDKMCKLLKDFEFDYEKAEKESHYTIARFGATTSTYFNWS